MDSFDCYVAMNLDIVVRKVAQDVLMFVFHKQGIIAEKPSPELSFLPYISAKFMKNLCISVWIDSYCNVFIWEDYIKSHFRRMITTPYLFANYVLYACFVVKCRDGSAFTNFCDTLSLVIHFALHCWQEERQEFLTTCVELFCTFFESYIRKKFTYQGGWKDFDDYLDYHHPRLHRYKDLIEAHRPEHEIFRELQDQHLNYTEPYVLGEVVISAISDQEVEDMGVAYRLAERIADEIRKLCKQPFEEVMADFAQTERLVEANYRKVVGEATGGIASDAEQSSQKNKEDFNAKANDEEQSPLQQDQEDLDAKAKVEEQSPLQQDQADLDAKANVEEQSSQKDEEASRGKATSIKNEDQTLDDLGSTKSQDFGPATQIMDLSPDLTNAGRAKILLQDMLNDIPHIYELIKFVCLEGPIPMMDIVQVA